VLEQVLEHKLRKYRCWNTIAETQMQKHSAETDAGTQNAETQMLEQRCRNTVLKLEQVLEHKMRKYRCWNTIVETQMQKHNAERDAGTQNAEMQMLEQRCRNTVLKHSAGTGAGTQNAEHRCWNTNAGTQMLKHSV
jgi:hypothetical protein